MPATPTRWITLPHLCSWHVCPDLLGLYTHRTFCSNLCPTCPSMGFPEKSQGKLTSRATPFACVALMGVGLLGLFCSFPAVRWEQEAREKCFSSGQGFLLSSHKASASCSKFLMNAFHLKSSLALKEANFDSTVSQDNLARKYPDEFSFFFFFFPFKVGNGHERLQSGTEVEINSRELMQHHWSKAVSRDAWWSSEFKEVRWCFLFLLL